MKLNNKIYNENDDIYKNVRSYYQDLKNRIVKPEKKQVAPVKAMGGAIVKIPFHHTFDQNEDEYDDDIPLTGPIFKITRNAKRDDVSSQKHKNGSKRSYKRRKDGEGDDYSYVYTEDSDEDIIPPKIMYGTINTLYKEYIKKLDLEKYPEFEDLGKKYLSRAIFTIDKTEHKKFQKLKKREAKRLK